MSDEKRNDAPGHDKTYDIIVNGRPRTVTEHRLSYLDVVQLAYPGESPSETVSFTVTYSNLHGQNGMLVQGQEVTVKDGMVFNVTKTNQA